MNEDQITYEVVEDEVVNSPASTTKAGSKTPTTTNFFIPTGVNASELTLENYREKTGKRFRMTKNQATVRGLNRKAAFEESKAFAISQLGENS
jgi:hypothetical protein